MEPAASGLRQHGVDEHSAARAVADSPGDRGQQRTRCAVSDDYDGIVSTAGATAAAYFG